MNHYHNEQARTAAKFVYMKLCRQGHLEAAQRVLWLLQDGRRTFGISDADWTAHIALEAEKCIPYSTTRKVLSCCFTLMR